VNNVKLQLALTIAFVALVTAQLLTWLDHSGLW
jgi:hypothetical protein